MAGGMKRRDFLRTTVGVGAGAAAAAVAGPLLWLPRTARAATPAFGQVKHVLILFAKGGFRSHCMFNAVGNGQHNPFGAQDAAPGTDWRLGAACGRKSYPSSLGVVPAFADVTGDVAVIPCVDHLPDSPRSDADHRTAVNRMCTGDPEGADGLLSRIGLVHPQYADGFSALAMPPVEIRPTEFGLGSGDYSRSRPLALQGADNNFAADLPVGRGWKIAARSKMNERFIHSRSQAYKERLGLFLLAKERAGIFAELLQDPRLNVIAQPGGQDAGVTNQQLIEVLGNHDLMDIGDGQPHRSWGGDVALALRFLGMGSPAAVVTRDIYDLHDDERDWFAPRTEDLSRQLAGLNFLLKRMTHPDGGTFWDHTLVLTLSEFSRNNTGKETGFNSGNGSDHVDERDAPSRNQALAFMGGAVTAGGRLLGASDEEMRPQDRVYSSRSVLATVMDVLGLDSTAHWPEPPISELFAG